MIALHALWTPSRLCLWGEEATSPSEVHDGRGIAATDQTPGGRLHDPAQHPFALSPDALKQVVGDLWDDGLLASGAVPDSMSLRLPSHADHPETSPELAGSAERDAPDAHHDQLPGHLAAWSVPCLAFAAPEAVDLLTAVPTAKPGRYAIGISMQYWSRLAHLVNEVLAAQRFVPDVQTDDSGRHEALWRAVLDAPGVSDWLATVIAAMPPVCRAAVENGSDRPSVALVESFLAQTIDATVRRSLADDPLVRSLQQRRREEGVPELPWLAALVGPESGVVGTPEEQAHLSHQVRSWVGQLEETAGHAHFRTCFRLTPPDEADDGDGVGGDTSGDRTAEAEVWTVSFHLQATDDPTVILDAERIWSGGAGLTLIRRQHELLVEQLEADLRRAAHLFEPLSRHIERVAHPASLRLDTQTAYAFLREAAPLLELNGFAVLLPSWWKADRPQLGLRLQVDPAPSEPGSGIGPRLGLDALVDYRWEVALGDQTVSLDEFRRLCIPGQSLLRLHGRWIEARPEATQSAWEFLQTAPTGRTTLFQALRFAAGTAPPTDLPITGLTATGWLEAALDSVGTEKQKITDVPQPEAFCGQLRPYQLKGLSWLSFLDRYELGGCLADDMGLGKTIQLIALLLAERRDGANPGPTLLVVPMSLVGNWQRELQRFAPSIRTMVHHGSERLSGAAFVEQVGLHDVVISTYALCHRDFSHLARVEWLRVALDEAQNIKNPAAKQTAAIRRLRGRRRLGLTGTPLENHLTELWSIMEFLNPGLLGTAAEFRRHFAVPIEKHHEADRADQLRRLVQPFMLRRRKTEPGIAADLPEKMEMKVYCNLSREQAVLYQQVVDDMLGHIELAGGIRRRGLVLAGLTRLKQICNHPAAVGGAGNQPPDNRGLAGRSGKVERLAEMLEEVLAEGERALVFTQFRRLGHLLEGHLPDRLGCGLLFLHGGTTAPARTAMVDRFQSNDPTCPVFLLSLKAGGFGLNLTSATHVFHFDRWWHPAVEDQATDRVHRIGQNRRVQVHKFVCVGTLEERIDRMLEEKRDLADRILGSGEQWLTELSTDDLREVLTLSQDAVAED
ncbi:MAG: DEAD/DEAH box helicase [bacterium]|nr:DEAD/DEAH box helicase [bacterium]